MAGKKNLHGRKKNCMNAPFVESMRHLCMAGNRGVFSVECVIYGFCRENSEIFFFFGGAGNGAG